MYVRPTISTRPDPLLSATTLFRSWVVFHLPLRRGLAGVLPSRLAHALRARHAVTGRAQSVEHVIDGIAHALRHQPAHDLGDTGAESDAAPFGIALYRIGALVVRRHVLGPVAR